MRLKIALIRPCKLNSLFIVTRFLNLHEGGRSIFNIQYNYDQKNTLASYGWLTINTKKQSNYSNKIMFSYTHVHVFPLLQSLKKDKYHLQNSVPPQCIHSIKSSGSYSTSSDLNALMMSIYIQVAKVVRKDFPDCTSPLHHFFPILSNNFTISLLVRSSTYLGSAGLLNFR